MYHSDTTNATVTSFYHDDGATYVPISDCGDRVQNGEAAIEAACPSKVFNDERRVSTYTLALTLPFLLTGLVACA